MVNPLKFFANRLFVTVVALVCVTVTGLLLVKHKYGYSAPWYTTPWPDPTPRTDLAIIMPVNENSDLQFYHNMWVGEYLRPVCDFKEEHCSIVCNHHSTWDTLDRKTRCFARELKAYYKDTEFFIKLDDDAFVDYQYVMGLMEKYRGYDKPVYISDFILNIDWSSQVLNNTWYGNGKFYMFNRKLVDCMNPEILYDGHRNEDAVFGSMVHDGCGKVEQVREDDSKIWHREYRNKNKYIDLTAIKNYRKE